MRVAAYICFATIILAPVGLMFLFLAEDEEFAERQRESERRFYGD